MYTVLPLIGAIQRFLRAYMFSRGLAILRYLWLEAYLIIRSVTS